jgi:hypothetical protein
VMLKGLNSFSPRNSPKSHTKKSLKKSGRIPPKISHIASPPKRILSNKSPRSPTAMSLESTQNKGRPRSAAIKPTRSPRRASIGSTASAPDNSSSKKTKHDDDVSSSQKLSKKSRERSESPTPRKNSDQKEVFLFFLRMMCYSRFLKFLIANLVLILCRPKNLGICILPDPVF